MNAFKSFLHRKSIERSHYTAIGPGEDLEQEYIYGRLDPKIDQMRLLKLQRRRDKSDLISCNVRIFNIAKAPRYRALSYEWGAASPLRQIRVNGALLTIRENLWAFLDMYLTRSRSSGYLWIDQICIDQINLDERSCQVQLMSWIFSMATTVLVWLGHNSDLQLSHSCFWLKVTSCHCKLPPLSSESCIICGAFGDPVALSALASLTYWRRLWIIQELALARRTVFYLGRQKIDGSHLRGLFNSRIHHDPLYFLHHSDEESHVLWLLSFNKSCERSIWDVILDAYEVDNGIDCSNPRDLIFGLLGIAEKLPRLRVDYTLPAEEVFGDLLLSIMCASKYVGKHLTTMAAPMARLALRLGVPPYWYGVLQIDLTERNEARTIKSALRGFLGMLTLLQDIGLDKTSLSIDDVLIVMAHLQHVFGHRTWAQTARHEFPDHEFVHWMHPYHQAALPFFVDITPRARALCIRRGVPFFLPHIPWHLHGDLSDEQLEEFMWPRAEVSPEEVLAPAQKDCASCCRPLSDYGQAEDERESDNARSGSGYASKWRYNGLKFCNL